MSVWFCKIKKCFVFLKCPNDWRDVIEQTDNRHQLILTIVAYLLLGIVLNCIWPFPAFAAFCPLFIFIGGLGLWSILYFSRRIGSIIIELSDQPAAKKANTFYYSRCEDSILYIVGPLLIVLIFGIGGCSMFGVLQFTPTLIWVLILFATVVYISIIGYIQYIVLSLYIHNLAYGSGEYQQLPKSSVESIPAKLEWLQSLTKLCHTYRTCFFTLGSTYIIAFSGFCWLPQMQASTHSFAFFLLWSIIIVAIVCMFPFVSVLEHHWIKTIVANLKACYIQDLTTERQLQEKADTVKIPSRIQDIIYILYAMQILNSQDYPVKSKLTAYYATALSAFNFVAAALTVADGVNTILGALPHIP